MAGGIAQATQYWWVLLVTGLAWIALSLAILQFNLTSVWSIAILTGVVLLVAAGTEVMVTALAPSWKWAHALLAGLFAVGGVMAFAWPDSTFVVLARLISWYLLFLGTFEIVESLAVRGSLWGLRLVTGIATVAIAFWAAESLDRSATVLVLWIGIGALMRGISQLFLAFEWHHVHDAAEAATDVPRQARHVDLSSSQPAGRTS
jgi:uncharacterized membrane protein HdeD (DUF308 family)